MLRPVLALAVVLCLSRAGSASGQVVPILVDETDGGAAWWVDDASEPGACLAAVIESAGWADPASVQPDAPISRVYRRADITSANARQLAGLYGADAVVHGSVSATASEPVSWVGRVRAVVTIDAQWMSVQGSAVRDVRVVGIGVGETAEEAQAAACARAAERAGLALRATGTGGDVWSAALAADAQLVVRSDGRAIAFVGVRRALREALGDAADLREVWATEGAVGLSVADVPASAVRDAAVSLSGRAVDGGFVDDVDEEEGVLVLRVRGDGAPDTAR